MQQNEFQIYSPIRPINIEEKNIRTNTKQLYSDLNIRGETMTLKVKYTALNKYKRTKFERNSYKIEGQMQFINNITQWCATVFSIVGVSLNIEVERTTRCKYSPTYLKNSILKSSTMCFSRKNNK